MKSSCLAGRIPSTTGRGMSELQARYHSLFETTPDIVIIMDDRGIVVAANPAVQQVLGYDPNDLIGAPLSRIMPERYRDQHHQGFSRYLATGKRKLDWRSISLPGLKSDGCEIPLEIAFGEFEEAGRRFFTGILRDVSAAKTVAGNLEFLSLVAPKLASSRLDYQATLAAIAELAVPVLADWSTVDMVGPHGDLARLAVAHSDPAKVEFATEIASKYPTDPQATFGVPQVIRTGNAEYMTDIPADLLKNSAKSEEHLHMIESLGIRSYLIVPIAAYGRVYGALSLVQAESGRRFTQVDVPLLEELGRRAGLAVHNAELYQEALRANQLLEAQAAELQQQTEEAQSLAEEMEAQTEELLSSAEELRRKTEEAAAANATKSAFLANMSHELRTPLNAIGGYVELLELGIRGAITEEQRTDLQRIQLNQRHLLGLINDVLNFAKVDAGRLEYRADVVPLDEALKNCEAMVLPQIHNQKISYQYVECGEAVTVKADHDKVQQIVLNLLSNAIKFTPEGGELTASCDQTDDTGRIHIRDSGIGIDADKLETIFEPFVQINRSLNQPGQGAGLGLAISRSLARAMGGDIAVVSELGVGSTFTLTLPRKDVPTKTTTNSPS